MEVDPVKLETNDDQPVSETKDEPSTSTDVDDKQKKRKVVGFKSKSIFVHLWLLFPILTIFANFSFK